MRVLRVCNPFRRNHTQQSTIGEAENPNAFSVGHKVSPRVLCVCDTNQVQTDSLENPKSCKTSGSAKKRTHHRFGRWDSEAARNAAAIYRHRNFRTTNGVRIHLFGDVPTVFMGGGNKKKAKPSGRGPLEMMMLQDMIPLKKRRLPLKKIAR